MTPVDISKDKQYRWMVLDGPDGQPVLGLVPDDEH